MEQKTTALEHLKRMAVRCTREIAALAGLVVDAVEYDFEMTTIPASAWRENPDGAAMGFAYMADVTVQAAAEKDGADAVLPPESLNAASGCGMASSAAVLDGKVRFYAVQAPAEDLPVQIRIVRGKAREET